LVGQFYKRDLAICKAYCLCRASDVARQRFDGKVSKSLCVRMCVRERVRVRVGMCVFVCAMAYSRVRIGSIGASEKKRKSLNIMQGKTVDLIFETSLLGS